MTEQVSEFSVVLLRMDHLYIQALVGVLQETLRERGRLGLPSPRPFSCLCQWTLLFFRHSAKGLIEVRWHVRKIDVVILLPETADIASVRAVALSVGFSMDVALSVSQGAHCHSDVINGFMVYNG